MATGWSSTGTARARSGPEPPTAGSRWSPRPWTSAACSRSWTTQKPRRVHQHGVAKPPSSRRCCGRRRAQPYIPPRARGGRRGGLLLRPLGQDGRRVGRGVRERVEGILAEVVYVVAGQVVAGVEGRAGLPAERVLLPFGLRGLRAGEEAARRDALVLEGAVVRAAFERRVGLGRDVPGLEVRSEDVLDLVRPLVDGVDGVWGAGHVEVEVGGDVLDLALFQVLDVVPGAEEPDLLGPPEREADPVAGLCVQLGAPERDLEHRRRPRAVVVDAWPLGHGIQVRPDHQGFIPAPRSFGYDVGRAVAAAPAHEDPHPRRSPIRQQPVAERSVRADHWYANSGRSERPKQHFAAGLARVEDDRRGRPGLLRVGGLRPEGAGAAPQERDVVPREVFEVSRLAPARGTPGVHGPEHRLHFTCARALHEREVRLPDRGPSYDQVGRPGGQVAGKLEGLDLDLVARFAEALRDVIGGGVVAGGAGGAVAAVLVGDGLEALRVREDPVDRHGLAQFGRKTGFGGGGRRFPAARGQEAYEQRHKEWGMGWAHASHVMGTVS